MGSPVRIRSLVVAVVLLTAGCGGAVPGSTPGGAESPGGTGASGGGSGGGGGGGVASDTCRLLTVDEVAGALSTDPILTSGPDPNWDEGCVYALEGQPALVVRVVRADAENYFKQMTETRESVDGLADGAVYSTSDRELSIKTAGVVVRLRAAYASDAFTTLDNLTSLARIVIARIAGTAVPPEAQITAPPLVHVGAACELLTPDEVARVLGTQAITVVDTAGVQFCSYTLTSTGEYLASIYLDRKGGMAVWQDVLNAGEVVHVDGLGNDAVFDAFHKRLNVQVGDQIMHVELYAAPDDKALELDRALMEIMLGRL